MALSITKRDLHLDEIATTPNFFDESTVPGVLAGITSTSTDKFLILRPNHAPILASHFGYLSPESPVEGLFTVILPATVGILLYCPTTG